MLYRISNLGGWKILSRIQFLEWKIWGGKCYLESRIWGGGVENLGGECYLESPIWVGGKFGVENAISNLEFGGRKIWGKKC